MMEWDKRSQPPNQFSDAGEVGGGIGAAPDAGVGVGGALYVKVMTDEQLEVLRTQIAVYASICERLVEMHKAITAQQDLAGVRLGHLYSDPLVTNVGHKISARQRWTPTPVQLQKLEHIFDQGTGTPSKQKIKEITAELSQHGQISETNVYNWFQNRRARSKRKQMNATSSNAESEFEADAESPKEEKTNPENLLRQHNSTGAEDHCYQVQDMSSEIHTIPPHTDKVEPMFLSDGNGTAKPSQSSSQLAFYESILENSNAQICPTTMVTVGMDHFMGKMEAPGGYNPYHPGEDYSI